MAKSLGWVRFDHYSIAVPDADKAIDFHEKLFGLELDHAFNSPSEGFRGGLLDMPNGQGQVELMSPLGDDSFLHGFLAKHGPGLHHITVEVEDIEAAVAYLREELGIEPYRGIWSDHQWRQTFIHPRDSGGVLYQLFEWLPGHGPDNSVTDAQPAE
ncbi:MAG: methylmalonyl-CoA/ethylmalonyl-CoA epimerase [Chloroflexi bacterium]|nr:MAG: methylmalonyl-CoA/ethylmalonyl-CoA epimerase [Chloroflexota bacterium]